MIKNQAIENGLVCLGDSMSEITNNETPVSDSDRYQLICGVALGILAAVMAINNIGGSRWGDEEIKAANEKGTAYAWYQSKGIKESLVENHRDNVVAQLASTLVTGGQRKALEKDLERLNAELKRYKLEKREILLGSATVGQNNWSIEHNGKMGNVKGAKDWEDTLSRLEEAGDIFDYSAIFLNMAIVLGSISLLMTRKRVRSGFFFGMIGFGILGTYYLVDAFVFVGGF
jgi:hypothetical protein